MTNTDRLNLMEDAFFAYIAKKISTNSLCKKLSVLTSSLEVDNKQTSKTYTAFIVNNSKEPFFGMRIFPHPTNINIITESLVYKNEKLEEVKKKWDSIDKWIIEIDQNIFDRNELGLNPKELTAMLIHEMAHAVYSDVIIERLYRAYTESYIKMKHAEKETVKIMHSLYSVGLIAACSIRDWSVGKNGIKEEFFCDKLLGNKEYRQYIVSALEKILKAYGNSELTSNAQADAQVEAAINWCNLNVRDLLIRKNKLKDSLVFNASKTSSNFLKELYTSLLNFLGVQMQEKYTGASIESFMEVYECEDIFSNYNIRYDEKRFSMLSAAIESYMTKDYTAAMEGYSRSKIENILSDYDIDVMTVEIDKIRTHQDRIFVLDLIYDKIKDVEEFKEYLERDSYIAKKYSDRILRVTTRLNELRNKVIEKTYPSSRYKLFVKVPEGYEG